MMMDKELYPMEFASTLNEEQLERYKNIIEERKRLCFEGYGLGLFIGIVLVVFNVYQKKRKMSRLSMACIVGSTMFLVQYFYYILSPKSDWMLLHLTDKQQNEKWLDVYRTMQYNCHVGVVLGLVGATALGNIAC